MYCDLSSVLRADRVLIGVTEYALHMLAVGLRPQI